MAKNNPSTKIDLRAIYNLLHKHFGHQNWWPGETPIEIMVGAILTQNTSWVNVEKAIENLKREKALSFQALKRISKEKLAKLIRPSGYFNQKTQRLKRLIQFIDKEYGGSIQKMRREPLHKLRTRLLNINGIGPETADSILLYALDKESFVIDAYTKRIFRRHQIYPENDDYEAWKLFFESRLTRSQPLYNDYHAQIVMLAKAYCKTTAQCEGCPLEPILPK